jgi:hypothetical protein
MAEIVLASGSEQADLSCGHVSAVSDGHDPLTRQSLRRNHDCNSQMRGLTRGPFAARKCDEGLSASREDLERPPVLVRPVAGAPGVNRRPLPGEELEPVDSETANSMEDRRAIPGHPRWLSLITPRHSRLAVQGQRVTDKSRYTLLRLVMPVESSTRSCWRNRFIASDDNLQMLYVLPIALAAASAAASELAKVSTAARGSDVP